MRQKFSPPTMAHATKILPPDDSSAHSGMVAYLLHCLLQDSELAAQRLHPAILEASRLWILWVTVL